MSRRGIISLAFLWHMHQPYYKDSLGGSYLLPWVRLHGLKDYLDMVTILRDFPRLKQTFNLVPCLLDQIIDYASGTAEDEYLQVGRKPAALLTAGEHAFMLENFFRAHQDHLIKPSPRYWELLLRRGLSYRPGDFGGVEKKFRTEDYLDLQVLFHLAWTDPSLREEIPELKELQAKGRGYTEEDKHRLFAAQREILGKIIPAYREAAARGQIEISASPYFHPILPLLCESRSAWEAMPDAELPACEFQHPEDAEWHIHQAVARFQELFGQAPRGMWPSEGSVSETILPLLTSAGIRWIASDEEILYRSVLHPPRNGEEAERLRYAAYSTGKDPRRPAIFFRDHTLSDLIGFVYQRMDFHQAVDDFIHRLQDIARRAADQPPGETIVPVILDGENAWEHYPNDGRDFLLYLYERLSEEENIICTTFSDYLAKFPPQKTLARLFAGSWINHNFSIWIGHPEDNRAWELLAQTRAAVVEASAQPEADKEVQERAMREIHIAEGSDWYWWFGADHHSLDDERFDAQFRMHLSNAYQIIGQEPPPELKLPIMARERVAPAVKKTWTLIYPAIDGRVSSYFEWREAMCFDKAGGAGAMHRGTSLVDAVYYGLNAEQLCLRLDLNIPPAELFQRQVAFAVNIFKPFTRRLVFTPRADGTFEPELAKVNGDQPCASELKTKVAADEIIEVAIAFEDINAPEEAEIHFTVEELTQGAVSAYWPPGNVFTLRRPIPADEDIFRYI